MTAERQVIHLDGIISINMICQRVTCTVPCNIFVVSVIHQILYVGEWLDGMMNGHGSYYFPNGDTYCGANFCCIIA